MNDNLKARIEALPPHWFAETGEQRLFLDRAAVLALLVGEEPPLAQLRKLEQKWRKGEGYYRSVTDERWHCAEELSDLLADLEAAPPQPTRGDVAEQLISRCTSFLGNGGFFNPDMMEQQKATQLILDCRAFLADLEAPTQEKRCSACGIETLFTNLSGKVICGTCTQEKV